MQASQCVFPHEDADEEKRNIPIGSKVCVKWPSGHIEPAVVVRMDMNPTYVLRLPNGVVQTFRWYWVGTYPHKVSPTAVDVVTRGKLNDDVISQIKKFGGKKSRKVRKSRKPRKPRKSRTRKQ